MKKKLLALLLMLLIPLSALAATTVHYGYITPTVGGSQNTWGTLLNTIFGTIDSNIWSASNGTTIGVNAPAASGSNITLTNPINNIQNISFSTTGKKLILSAMNASASPVAGGSFYVSNVGSNTFAIDANDGTTAIVAALAPGQTVTLQLTSGSTANGAFNVLGPYIISTSPLSFTNVSIGASYSSTSPPTNGLIVQGNVGIGTSAPVNTLDIYGAVAIGTGYAGVNTAPTNGLLSQGNVGIGTTVAGSQLTVGNAGQFTVSNSGVLNLSGLTASELVATDGSKNLTNITALPSGTTATTQSLNDSSSKVATTGFSNPASDISSSGYQKFPSGVIFQWGSVADTLGSAGKSPNFPLTFPGGIWSLVISQQTGNSTDQFLPRITSSSTSGFTYVWDNFGSEGSGASTVITYLAIGN